MMSEIIPGEDGVKGQLVIQACTGVDLRIYRIRYGECPNCFYLHEHAHSTYSGDPY